MQKRNLDNKTLDATGRKLIVSERSRPADIDKIVSSPHLFELVTAKIAQNEMSGHSSQTNGNSAFQFLQRNAVAFACITVLIAGAIGLAAILRPDSLNEVSGIQVPDADPDIARPEVPPDPFVGKLSAGRALKTDFRIVKAKTVVRNVPKKLRTPVPKLNAEFYAVGYTGDPAETASGGHIIRVELNRSSLFAVGVKLPLENTEESFKADLLIGSDGVTRGVRIVN